MKLHHNNQKKIGFIYLAALAIGLTPNKAKELLKIESFEALREKWDYRAHNLNIKEARAALLAASSRPSIHLNEKENYRPYQFCPAILAYVIKRKDRDEVRESNLKKIAKYSVAITLDEVTRFTNGLYCGFGCVLPLKENSLLIERNEKVIWSKNASLKLPVARHATFSFRLISSDGDTIASGAIKTRMGDWLGKIGVSLGLVTGELTPITQTASMIPVWQHEQGGMTIIELRLFGVGFSSYCATADNFHFHAPSKQEAIRGLLRKMRAAYTNF